MKTSKKIQLTAVFTSANNKVIMVGFYLLNCFSIFEQQDTQSLSSSIFPDHSDLDQDQALKKNCNTWKLLSNLP